MEIEKISWVLENNLVVHDVVLTLSVSVGFNFAMMSKSRGLESDRIGLECLDIVVCLLVVDQWIGGGEVDFMTKSLGISTITSKRHRLQ